MQAYVINLRRRADRRERFLAWNEGKGIAFEFVEAVEGRMLSRAALQRNGLIVGSLTRFSDGALGNALSQRGLWEKIAAGDEPALIFEDDAFLHRRFAGQLEACAQALGDGTDMLFLGYNRDAVVSLRFIAGGWVDLYFLPVLGDFERFAAAYDEEPVTPQIFDARLRWGTLACLVSPKGARTLLEGAFPLRPDLPVELYGQKRSIMAYSIDGVLNSMSQAGKLRAKCLFPPLAISANDRHDSDVVGPNA